MHAIYEEGMECGHRQHCARHTAPGPMRLMALAPPVEFKSTGRHRLRLHLRKKEAVAMWDAAPINKCGCLQVCEGCDCKHLPHCTRILPDL